MRLFIRNEPVLIEGSLEQHSSLGAHREARVSRCDDDVLSPWSAFLTIVMPPEVREDNTRELFRLIGRAAFQLVKQLFELVEPWLVTCAYAGCQWAVQIDENLSKGVPPGCCSKASLNKRRTPAFVVSSTLASSPADSWITPFRWRLFATTAISSLVPSFDAKNSAVSRVLSSM